MSRLFDESCATRQVGQHGEHSIVRRDACGRKHCIKSQEQKMESTERATAISRISDKHVSDSSVTGSNFSNFFGDRAQVLSSSDSFVLADYFSFRCPAKATPRGYGCDIHHSYRTSDSHSSVGVHFRSAFGSQPKRWLKTCSSIAVSRHHTAHQLSHCLWMTNVVVTLQAGIREARCTLSLARTKSIMACQSLDVQDGSLHQARRSGSSIDRTLHARSLTECTSRGHWRTDQSMQRCEKISRFAADHLALLRATQDPVETFDPHAHPSLGSQSIQ